MKTKNRLLASILCLFILSSCFVSLFACDKDNKCNHQWGEWSTTTNATCTESGSQERKCSECGETETSTVNALGHDWNEATCSTPKTCKNCSATEGSALSHTYTVETVKSNAIKSPATCTKGAVYYKSCSCGAISTSDADTFTSGAPATHIFSVKTVKDEALKSEATCMSAAIYYTSCSCGAISTDDSDTFTNGSVLKHIDVNKDHICDYNCGKNVGTCVDTNKDHICDYGCAKTYGDHTDGDDSNHLCDYGCEKVADDGCYDTVADGKCDECEVDIDHPCADDDKDHDCDYGCPKVFGVCEDNDKDHDCDYGCETVLGICEDSDKDHDCDYGCAKTFGEHADGNDNNHLCDYGCEKIADNGCYDTVVDGKCDECDVDIDHNCIDNNKNHACDICSSNIGEHVDNNKDHVCDYGCINKIGNCVDSNRDHHCDYGSACEATFGTCEDTNFDHACDYGCNQLLGACEDSNKDHECDHGCDKTFGDHADSPIDNDHVCDYGCEAVIEDCSDKANDNDHNCDVCNNADITSHSYSDPTCATTATCSECGATTGTTLDHKDDNRDHVCDNKCGKNDIGVHSDSNTDSDHVCDYGCNAILENCSDVTTDKDHSCDICKKANVTSHAHVEKPELATEATCLAAAKKTYECNCGDKYTENDGDALGHDITGVKAIEKHVLGCEYVLVYICQRNNCRAEVFGESVYHHDYIASIGTPATCTTHGEKTFKCDDCGDTSKEPEKIPADTTGHKWSTESTENGTRTDICSICSTTRSVIVSTNNSASSNASDLADADVQLKVDDGTNANIQLGHGVADAIGDKNITISAGVIDKNTLENMGVSEDQLEQIGTNTVYDFNMKDENGTPISNFGENNFVTITLPYSLGKDEDIDSIAVWFISDTCQIEECDKGEKCVDAHKLVSIEATYNNGFVTFQTNHFSIYTVTRLTPAERCELYGHGYAEQVVEGSCTKDGYVLLVCVRCHDKQIKEGTFVKGDGHDYSSEIHNATCTESGYILYACNDCDHSYKTKINATGHKWSVIDSGDTSCTTDGFVKYGCDNCSDEYTVTYAKTGHIYTNTVVPATCSSDGYTLHECNNCDYSYTDSYIDALEHSYEAGEWAWEANGNKATLNLVCKHDNTHVTKLHVISTMEKVVEKGECSNYVIRTHTATVEFNGVTYTDVMIIRQGNPQHKFSSEWTVGENEHWHECVCGEKADVTKHTFGNPTVTKDPTCTEAGESTAYCTCGKSEITSIPSAGGHTYENGICINCGTELADSYYVNLVNSWKDIDGFAIKIQNFSYELKHNDISLLDSFKLVGSIKQIDIAELALYIENGELGGAATGSIVVFNIPNSNPNSIYKFKAVIHEGYVYITVEYGKDDANKNINLKISVDSLIEYLLDSMDIEGESLYVFDFLKETIIPLVEMKSEEANSILEDLFNIIFTFEKQPDGSYIATVDYEKLYTLNENLSTKSVAEIVDIYFGDSTFDKAVDSIREILDLKIPEIPAYLDEHGIDSAELIEALNGLIAKMGASEKYDIADLINDEKYADTTIGMLIFRVRDDSYVDSFNKKIDYLREKSLYALINSNSVDHIKNRVTNILDMISDCVSISFATNNSGMLTSISIDTNNFIYNYGSSELQISFGLDIIINEKIDVTWSDIIDEIEDNIVLPNDESLEDDSNSYYGYGYSGYVNYQGKEYFYTDAIRITAYKRLHDKLTYIMFSPDCKDWTKYNTCYSGGLYVFTVTTILVDGNPVMLLIDHYSGDVVRLVETETGYIAIFKDGTEKPITFDFSAYNKDIAKAYADLYFLIFEDPEGILLNRYAYYSYYYNAELQKYATESQHELKYEYDIHGDTCKDGCTIYTTCNNCDYTYENTRYWCDIDYDAEIDLSEYSSCGGTVGAELCTVCGFTYRINYMEFNCNMEDKVATDITDEEGNVIGTTYTSTCHDCGLVLISKEWIDRHTACEYTEYNGTYIYKGDVCILECVRNWYGVDHEYKFTYEFDGNTCEDGYYVTRYCSKCNDSARYHDWGHRTDWKEINMEELGFCGGYICEYYCSICETIVNTYIEDYFCWWEYVNTNADGGAVYECHDCGATKVLYTTIEKDDDCMCTQTEITIYIINDKEIYKNEEIHYYTQHEHKYDFVMYGNSCIDGYTVITTCKDCDFYETSEYDYHTSFTAFETKELIGCCKDHYITVEHCPCGQDRYIDFSHYSFRYDDESNMYICDDCGLAVSSITSEIENGCSKTVTLIFTVYLDNEELYSFKNEQNFANHKFSDVETSVINGIMTIIVSCERCDTVKASEILSVEMEEHDDEYYYDYSFTPDTSANYTIVGLSDRDTYVELFMVIDGKMIYINTNDDDGSNGQFLLSSDLTAGTTYIYRISFYGQNKKGTISFSLTQSTLAGSKCDHYDSKDFALLLDGSETCEDGAIYGSICVDCGSIKNISVENTHRIITKDSMNLSDHGACYGEFFEQSCACGQKHRSYMSDYCYDYWTDNEYYDDQGRLIHVDVYSCSDCGLRHTLSYYTVKDHEACTRTYYYTEVVNIGAKLVAETEYTNVRIDHEVITTATLLGGEGSSCEDGVIITQKCKDCGIEDSNKYYDHESYEKEHINLSELGSVCGGYATLYGCACDKYNNLSLEHSLCEWNEKWDGSSWIEDAIPEGQEQINEYTYIWNQSYISVCAVTDPACAYKIRHASYWLKDKNSCSAYSYETWQFGYNEETGSYEYEITFRTGNKTTHHNYIDGSTDHHTKYDCPDCGSYYYENWYFDENENNTKYERIISNTIANGYDKYSEYVEEYALDDNGNFFTCREYSKYIRYNNEEYWYERITNQQQYTGTFGDPGRKISRSYTDSHGENYTEEYAFVLYKGYNYSIYTLKTEGDYWYRYDYTYTFEGGCSRTEIYTDSTGEYTENTYGNCNFWQTITIKHPTCSQDGLECRECKFCGKQTEHYTISAHDHSWVQIKDNWYYCFTCGLENANGVSGDIIMEDLTEQYGNDEYYVVGYYSGSYLDFTYYVSLILADGTEVAIWDDIEFTTIDGLRAYAFSKAAVEAWATENGYTDYKVRFSFVPIGSDGSFDYGITFTETIDIDTVVDSVSFVDYIAEGESKSYTITPAEDSVWTFTSKANTDTYGYLYDADENLIVTDDDDGEGSNFMITYELKAGETYIVKVRWYHSSQAGNISLLFIREAIAAN